MHLIDGVVVRKLKVIPDERGRVMEIMRSDDDVFSSFGQVYMTTAYPGVVKGWHYHKKQTDHFTCVKGMTKLVLYDDRKDSPTFRCINEFFIGEHNPILVCIPPNIHHGFKCVSADESIMVNIPDRLYDYDEPDEHRVDPNSGEIPYAWERKNR